MRPRVEFTKSDFNTGVVRPSAIGVCAIIAAAAQGTVNVPATHARLDLALTEYGHGPLVEDAAYIMPNAGKPVVLVRAVASTPGAYSALVKTGAGTSVITAGASIPLDTFDVVVEFPTGGTIGSAGITYRASFNGGKDFTKVRALGTANTVTLLDGRDQPTGVGLAFGVGTVVAGTKVTFTTTEPKVTNADIIASLEALRVTSARFECVYIDMEADASTVSTVAAWIATMNLKGRFPTVVLTARKRASGETEAVYKDALAVLFDASACVDVVVMTDLEDVTSVIRGIVQPRRSGLPTVARGMKIDIGTDPAWVALGPIPNCSITDARGNPKYHDETNYPGIDDIRLGSLCTLEGREGVYIANARLLSPTGSDFVYWQHARVLNRGCEIAFQKLQEQLSRGVRKSDTVGPNGERYIDEEEAQLLESFANDPINREIVGPGRADDMKLVIARTDDISSNEGATITCELQSVALAYVKKFAVTAKYVKQITDGTSGT